MAKDYIYRLIKDQKLISLERSIELGFGSEIIKATVFRNADLNEITIVLADKYFKYIKAYRATEFDCYPIKQCALPYEYTDIPLSKSNTNDAEFRKFYLRFMKKTYDSFAADYRAYVSQQADLDLGETTSL